MHSFFSDKTKRYFLTQIFALQPFDAVGEADTPPVALQGFEWGACQNSDGMLRPVQCLVDVTGMVLVILGKLLAGIELPLFSRLLPQADRSGEITLLLQQGSRPGKRLPVHFHRQVRTQALLEQS